MSDEGDRYRVIAVSGYSASRSFATSYSVIDTAYCGVEVYREYVGDERDTRMGSGSIDLSDAARSGRAYRECDRLNAIDRNRSGTKSG